MKKHFARRLGAVCTSAVMSVGTMIAAGSAVSVPASAADTDNYAKLLQYSLYFFDANMCGGDVESASGITWRGNCHTSDEVPGGYHDAGDHAMFGLPQGYTAMTLGWTYYEYKSDFDSLGLTSHFKTISKRFTEFFKKSVKMSGGNVTSLLYQKGDGNEDHSYWGPPEQQGGGRKMFWTSNSAADIAADYASALAFDYMNFGDTESLDVAKALYKYSLSSNQVATDGPKGFYNNSSCQDEQCFAAGVLYLATKDNTYLNDLKSKQTQYQGWIYGWENKFLGAACLLGEATGDWSAATGWMNGKAGGGGYLFLDKWGSARLNCAFQTTAMIADKNGKGNYADFCKGQMNYLLGDNPSKTCFVTGYASNSAKNVHHRAASGYSGYGGFNGNGWNPDGDHNSPYAAYSDQGHTLIGALAGGPCDASGSYHDNMNDYVCNEVALDYNAALVGAAAGLYHKYKTGSCVTSIEGVKNINLNPSSNPDDTKPSQDTSKDTTKDTTKDTGSNPSTGGSLTFTKADDMDNNPKWVAQTNGATKVTFTLKTNSNDTEANGCFEINGAMTEWKATPSNGEMTVECEVPSGASQVSITVWWPTSATLESVTGNGGGNAGTQPSTTTKTTTTTTSTTTTTKTTTTTTTTTAAPTTTTTTTTEKREVVADLYGDVNCSGKVDISDAVLLARLIAEDANARVSEVGLKNADVTHDNQLNSDDVVKLLKYAAKILTADDLKY